MQKEQILSLLKEKGLRATPQRISVYKYCAEHRTHPDAQAVYDDVLKENPSFSKTTVYNALKELAEVGLLMPVLIDNEKIHYDADTSFHGHFKCNKCGKIYDFTADLPQNVSGLDGFDINQMDLYYSGICSTCINK